MLDFIPEKFEIESNIKKERILENNLALKNGIILYLMTRELRLEDNFGLNFALELSKKHKRHLKIICPYKKFEIPLKQAFMNDNIKILKENFSKTSFDFKIFKGDLEIYLQNEKIGAIVKDFNPIDNKVIFGGKIFTVDSHNIIPAFKITNKQEYSAMPFRRKVYLNIGNFLTEFPNNNIPKTFAYKELQNFIKNKLKYYAKLRNDPTKNVTSNLSKFLNWGFISSQRVALEILKSATTRENKETFLEEIIVRKELADNFCYFNKNFKNIKGAPTWGKQTLKLHQNDFREHLYSRKVFEEGRTTDELWNACESELLKTGKIHGYLRMYWAKKILEWTKTPEEAIKIAIYLNDKYALDAPSANGYEGILWAITGLSDSPFRERDVTGKIRKMSKKAIEKKFDTKKYIENFIL